MQQNMSKSKNQLLKKKKKTSRYSFQNRGFVMKGSMADQVGRSGLQFLGRFKNGQSKGHFWLGLINNGFIHGKVGKVDEKGLATGEDLAFIYPDGETALRGQFTNLCMKKAKHVDVLKYGCDKKWNVHSQEIL